MYIYVFHTYSNDVEEVIVPQRVQDGRDCLFGDSQSEAFHAAAHVHEDHHVFRGRRRLDVPALQTQSPSFTHGALDTHRLQTQLHSPFPISTVERYDPVFIWCPLYTCKRETTHQHVLYVSACMIWARLKQFVPDFKGLKSAH